MVLFIKILGIIAFAAVFFIIPALVIIYIVRIVRKTSVDQGLCRNCGYDLTSEARPNDDKCPQCGRPFARDQDGMPFS